MQIRAFAARGRSAAYVALPAWYVGLDWLSVRQEAGPNLYPIRTFAGGRWHRWPIWVLATPSGSPDPAAADACLPASGMR